MKTLSLVKEKVVFNYYLINSRLIGIFGSFHFFALQIHPDLQRMDSELLDNGLKRYVHINQVYVLTYAMYSRFTQILLCLYCIWKLALLKERVLLEFRPWSVKIEDKISKLLRSCHIRNSTMTKVGF